MIHSYHFRWQSSFDGHLYVSVTRDEPGCIVLVERGWFVEAHAPRRRLGQPDWRRLEAAITLAAFWEDPPAKQGLWGFDGATWLFEGRRGDQERSIDLWSPSDPIIRSLGRTFADLAGFPDLALY